MDKKISRARFNYLSENIGILNDMVHLPNGEYTIVIGESNLTSQIELLRKAVRLFEDNTGLKLIVK